MTEEERKAAIEREAMEWAKFLYDLYQDKKRKEAIENAVSND